MQNIVNKYSTINQSKLTDELKEELNILKSMSNDFTDNEIVSLPDFQSNFNELYETLKESYPESLKKNLPTKTKNQKAGQTPKSRSKKTTPKNTENHPKEGFKVGKIYIMRFIGDSDLKVKWKCIARTKAFATFQKVGSNETIKRKIQGTGKDERVFESNHSMAPSISASSELANSEEVIEASKKEQKQKKRNNFDHKSRGKKTAPKKSVSVEFNDNTPDYKSTSYNFKESEILFLKFVKVGKRYLDVLIANNSNIFNLQIRFDQFGFYKITHSDGVKLSKPLSHNMGPSVSEVMTHQLWRKNVSKEVEKLLSSLTQYLLYDKKFAIKKDVNSNFKSVFDFSAFNITKENRPIIYFKINKKSKDFINFDFANKQTPKKETPKAAPKPKMMVHKSRGKKTTKDTPRVDTPKEVETIAVKTTKQGEVYLSLEGLNLIERLFKWQEKSKPVSQITNAAKKINKLGTTGIFTESEKPFFRNLYNSLRSIQNNALDKRIKSKIIDFGPLYAEMENLLEEAIKEDRGYPQITEDYESYRSKELTEKDKNKMAELLDEVNQFVNRNKEELNKHELEALKQIHAAYANPVQNVVPNIENPLFGVEKKTKNMTALPSLNGFVTADQANLIQKPDTFRLKGSMGKFLQEMQPYRLAINISGNRGSGKTSFVTQLIDAFIDTGRKVGFFSLEQGGLESKDTSKLIEMYVKPKNRKNLAVTGEVANGLQSIKEFATHFDIVVIDSFNKLERYGSNVRFDELRLEYPDTIFIVIFQQNAQGTIRGGVAAEFDAPIVLKSHNPGKGFKENYISIEKNRGNDIDLIYKIADKQVKNRYDNE